jgi:hypothetical protein
VLPEGVGEAPRGAEVLLEAAVAVEAEDSRGAAVVREGDSVGADGSRQLLYLPNCLITAFWDGYAGTLFLDTRFLLVRCGIHVQNLPVHGTYRAYVRTLRMPRVDAVAGTYGWCGWCGWCAHSHHDVGAAMAVSKHSGKQPSLFFTFASQPPPLSSSFSPSPIPVHSLAAVLPIAPFIGPF